MLSLFNVAVEREDAVRGCRGFNLGSRAYIGVETDAKTERFRSVTHVTFTAPSSSYGLTVKTIQTSQRG
jgi:hypothetical protein